MIAAILRTLALAAQMHAVWPAQPIPRVLVAAVAAERAARPGLPAELLAAIAEHESDLRPNVVSWRDACGQRVDAVWESSSNSLKPLSAPNSVWRSSWPENAVCGFLQASGTPTECMAAIDLDGAMALGVVELQEWLRACRGDLRCALAGYAGGNSGARAALSGETTLATRFADLFLARARALHDAGVPWWPS